MPEISMLHIAILAGALMAGLVVGWVFRGRRAQEEKAAVSAGWQEQMDSQRQEHERLVAQNRSLMEQNSQYQASNRDSKMRASELSGALKEAFERRDELQRQLKDIRNILDGAVRERDRLRTDVRSAGAENEATSEALKRRDDRITKLTRELAGWQQRVPPLIEKFRERSEEALRLESELAAARDRIAALESVAGNGDTGVMPVDRSRLGNELDASNDPLDDGADGPQADTMHEAPPGTGDTGSEFAADSPVAREVPQEIPEVPGPDAETAFGIDGNGVDRQEAVRQSAPPANDAELVDQITGGGERDDLKQIRGVGPAIEKTLNEMGIRRFEQVAAMSEYDINRIAHRLKGFHSRIYREDWIGQARELRDRKGSRQA